LTSPRAGAGKSFTLANLAVALASGGEQVVVVDADMRKPHLHEFFNRPNLVGLADALSARESAEGGSRPIPLQETDVDNLLLLSAGRPSADPVTLLTSSRFPALLEALSGKGDVILVDSPPVLGPPDAAIMATRVEGTILVVSAGRTSRSLIRQARDRLQSQESVDLLGLAVNRVRSKGGYYGYMPDRKRKMSSWSQIVLGRGAGDGWMPLDEAAARLGVSRSQARKWCKSGRLPATKRLLWWRVDAEGLERTIEEMLTVNGTMGHEDVEREQVVGR
jgi:capsular exopolysaccharide synthesis family protein